MTRFLREVSSACNYISGSAIGFVLVTVWTGEPLNQRDMLLIAGGAFLVSFAIGLFYLRRKDQ